MKPLQRAFAVCLLLAICLSQFFYAPQTASAALCDAALFIADVNVPDRTVFPPTTAFTKTWRLKNVGSCTWTTAYKLAFAGGTPLSGPEDAPLPKTVAPGASVDVSVNLVSLAGNGTYRGYWQLKNAAGARFGLGAAADRFFWVEIVVRGGITQSTATRLPTVISPPTPTPPPSTGTMSDDFAASAGVASWQSGAGKLSFPGTDGDARGFALKRDSIQMETGATVSQPVLLMVPQNKTDGYMQALFPAITIQNGDHFQTTIGCQYGATSCYVTYRIDYRTSAGVKTLWKFTERYEGLTYNVNLDLSFLAGKKVEFFFLLLANGSPAGDRAVWIAPRIVRAGGAPATATPTALPTVTVTVIPTATPLHGNWLTYVNAGYGFQFQYPPNTTISDVSDTTAHFALPFAAGTNLVEKFLDVSVAPNASACTSPLTAGYAPGSFPSGTVSIHGISFVKENGADAGAGNIHQWTAYSTMKGGACISLSFVLHSTNPGNYATPPPLFDESAELAVLDEIMSTFGWAGMP